jgi:hypothetical protein
MTDGVSLIARRQLVPLSGGEAKPLSGLAANERIARFDGKSVWVTSEKNISRIDIATGRRETIFDYGSGNPRDSLFTEPPVVSADGRAYAYTYATLTSGLFVVDGTR